MNTRMQVKTDRLRNKMRLQIGMRGKDDMHLENDTQITNERQIDIECRSGAAPGSMRAHRRHSHLAVSLSARLSL
jgi:hypothetical protein